MYWLLDDVTSHNFFRVLLCSAVQVRPEMSESEALSSAILDEMDVLEAFAPDTPPQQVGFRQGVAIAAFTHLDEQMVVKHRPTETVLHQPCGLYHHCSTSVAACVEQPWQGLPLTAPRAWSSATGA